MSKTSLGKEILDWGLHLAVAVVVGYLLVVFVVQRTIVSGDSMFPTLHDGDQLVIQKITPRFGTIKRGDIVTVNAEKLISKKESPIIKRVIGLENDDVEVREGKVYLNGKELQEKYINGNATPASSGEYEKVKVPVGYFYIMGDNRLPNASRDSRSFGAVSKKDINGIAVIRFWPLNRFGNV
jgi:signal peptidase I